MPHSPLLRVAQGDRDAVEACLDAYGGLVWGLARRLCPNEADAEDAVQEIFIELWRCAGRFDPARAKATTFVAMVARRRLIDRLRRTGRRPEVSSISELVAPPASPAEPSDAAAELQDEAQRIREQLATLDEKQQTILRLSILGGLSHRQIAEQLELPLGTVKATIRRGLVKVREQLARREAVHP